MPAGYVDTLPQIFYRKAFAHSGDYNLPLNYRSVYAMPSLDATDANTEDAGMLFRAREHGQLGGNESTRQAMM